MKRILLKLWKFFLGAISDKHEPDAKRLGGFLGWLVCMGITIVGVFVEIKSPEIVDTLFWTSCILLGIDGITNMIQYQRNVNINKGKDKSKTDDEIY